MISAVVLAAGASSRMGSQKLLLPVAGEPLVTRTVRAVSAAGFDEVLVVVGFEHEKIETALQGLGVRAVVNPDYETGMGSSFRTAVGALPDACEAAMFALADQPLVTAAEYRRLLEAWQGKRDGIVRVSYGEVMAPPHLFAREFFPELAVLEHGARPVLRRHTDRTTVLQFPPELLLDVDTPEDYERASALLSAGR